jgi:hypothetical protein
MRSLLCAGAAIALACLSGCGRPPEPPPPPSGKGWRILAEGAQVITVRTIKTGRNSTLVSVSADRPNDSPKEAKATDEDTERQLTVGRNVSEFPFHPATASGKP